MDLIPNGAWQRGFLLAMQVEKASASLMIPVTDLARRQASWWIDHIRVAGMGSSIPDPRPMESMVPRKIFTDAAGGSNSLIKNGAGGICPPHDWFYLPWPKLIRKNTANKYDVKFAHKLSCLEGFACLLGLATVPNLARNKDVAILTDNSGFVGIFKKKHSSCPYSYTIAKAIHDVSIGLNCVVHIKKTPRVSGDWEVVADALSKGNWEQAWPLMPMKNDDPSYIPRALLRWINHPVPDMDLGKKVLAEMADYTHVLLGD